jgi:chitinase
VVGYFSSGSVARGYAVAKLPADHLDVVIYAFAAISPQGECMLLNAQADKANFAALQQLKGLHPRLKTQLSVGGWAHSDLFSDAALTPDSRATFARSCVALMQQYGFDGIDLDWEYPVRGGLPGNHHDPRDKENFTALLAELRAQLDAAGRPKGDHYLLSIAAPAGKSEYQNLELDKLAPLVDRVDLMAYGFATESSRVTYFKEPLYAPAQTDPTSSPPHTQNADEVVKAYLQAKVPASRLLLGVAFYGQGWHVSTDTPDGLFQPVDALPQGTWKQDGVYSYQDLVDHHFSTDARHFEAGAKVPWLYNPAQQIFISYEDPQSLAFKADYVRANHLGGMMFWEASFDDGSSSLVNAIYSRFHPAQAPATTPSPAGTPTATGTP